MSGKWKLEEWHNRTDLGEASQRGDAYRLLNDGEQVLAVSMNDETREVARVLRRIVRSLNEVR